MSHRYCTREALLFRSHYTIAPKRATSGVTTESSTREAVDQTPLTFEYMHMLNTNMAARPTTVETW